MRSVAREELGYPTCSHDEQTNATGWLYDRCVGECPNRPFIDVSEMKQKIQNWCSKYSCAHAQYNYLGRVLTVCTHWKSRKVAG